MNNIYFCKKGNKIFTKDQVYEFEEKTVENKKVFEIIGTKFDKHKILQISHSKFKEHFCKYTDQKLVLTSSNLDCAPLNKGSQVYRWLTITALVLISIVGLIYVNYKIQQKVIGKK